MSSTPAINQPWPEQGGIFIGSRLIDGLMHHIIIPGGIEFDHTDIPFSRVEQVVNEGDELNGFSDWRAPDKEDLMLAYINSREHFDSDEWYWSRTPDCEHWALAVDFEYVRTHYFSRSHEFRVRPVRSFPASAI